MIVEKRISFVRLIRLIWRELVGILLVSAIPVIGLMYFDLSKYAINASIPLVIGTAIAIFLGFRTNSAYERWWEARKLWGSLINDSRNLARLCNDFFGDEAPDQVRRVCYRQIAIAQLMCARLKGLPHPTSLQSLLSEAELGAVHRARDPIVVLLNQQGATIREVYKADQIDTRQFVMVEETISRVADDYGGCQRILATVFPVHYTFFTRVFIWIFIGLLGFSLPAHENANYFLIPAIFLIGWVFFMVEGIGNYMQDPFTDNRNVIPMEALSRVIEINLRESLGETDLPDWIKPIDGALM